MEKVTLLWIISVSTIHLLLELSKVKKLNLSKGCNEKKKKLRLFFHLTNNLTLVMCN